MLTCEAETGAAVDGERCRAIHVDRGGPVSLQLSRRHVFADAGLDEAGRRVGQHRHARALAGGVGQNLPGLIRAAELEDTDRDEQQHRDA